MCSEQSKNVRSNFDKELLILAASRGLDFFVQHQKNDLFDANHGRFPWAYDISKNVILFYSTNWSTSVVIEALILGYKVTKYQRYIDAAERGISYLKSLQVIDFKKPRITGVFREDTPQSNYCCPRDGITAAWAMLDWYLQTGDKDALQRAELYAEWFKTIGMERGFPYWKIFLDKNEWEPRWSGSFQSGGGFFLGRLFQITQKKEYLDCMERLLSHYNQTHLDESGNVHVIADEQGNVIHKFISDQADLEWQIMHRYNDDFGCLANLLAFQITQQKKYQEAAERFLRKIQTCQNPDGGFGPAGYSVPSAAGCILIESVSAARCGLQVVSEDCLSGAIEYILSLQQNCPNSPQDGCFVDNQALMLARTGAYSIMALYQAATSTDGPYCISL